MTDDEWNGLSMLLDKGFKWREPFGEAQSQAYRVLLDGHDAGHIAGALRALVEKGQVFGPTPGEIVELIKGDDASTPTFAECYQLIYGKGGIMRARPSESTWATPGARDAAYDQAALERAKTMHPLVASFAERQGIRRLRLLAVEHPDHGELVRKDLEASWKQHVAAMAGRDLVAIAAGVGRGNGELSRFDPLSVLNVPRPETPQIEQEASF